ncbi:cytochrome c [Flagellatimonas centrodinii]|uniref:cytochrome c n=1 Tax=Flagellatimonas centrodinii TaxID=2806210 RepID=UPI001FEDCD1E|nr:cytochrome c [Flagellatimonas centrodinii]ULQ47495.1 cytochrome c [Flagellatimonas centrodinii]
MKRAFWGLFGVALAGAALMLWLGLRPPPAPPLDARSPLSLTADSAVERGRYLATLGNCRACHTAPQGADYAGGRAIPTPFGTFYAPNITPDPVAGIGTWSADDFWRALHDGRSADGTLLYPVFPYTNYTRMTRDDSDALWAWLQTVPAAPDPNRDHDLRFPFDQRLLLVGWRALFFRAGVFEADPAQDAVWNRGAYLVQGPGHCSACHAARNALGAPSPATPAGGLVLNWYAPSLTALAEAGVQHWSAADIVTVMRDGKGPTASTLGPMAEVVFESLQHWRDDDLQAMAHYLRRLPPTVAPADGGGVRVPNRVVPEMQARGENLYRQHCADCHGEGGEGRTPAAPPLAGNRAVQLASPVNAVRVVLHGGYPPGTAGNPQPFGMPPYGFQFSDQEVADVLTFVRGAWGNAAAPVSPEDVRRLRGSPLW